MSGMQRMFFSPLTEDYCLKCGKPVKPEEEYCPELQEAQADFRSGTDAALPIHDRMRRSLLAIQILWKQRIRYLLCEEPFAGYCGETVRQMESGCDQSQFLLTPRKKTNAEDLIRQRNWQGKLGKNLTYSGRQRIYL